MAEPSLCSLHHYRRPQASDPFAPNAPRQVPIYDKTAPKALPQLVLAVEHYNRIARMLAAGEKVKMTVDLGVEWQDADPMGYNTIAEIPGTDLKDEIVMLGGHMDSWQRGLARRITAREYPWRWKRCAYFKRWG